MHHCARNFGKSTFILIGYFYSRGTARRKQLSRILCSMTSLRRLLAGTLCVGLNGSTPYSGTRCKTKIWHAYTGTHMEGHSCVTPFYSKWHLPVQFQNTSLRYGQFAQAFTESLASNDCNSLPRSHSLPLMQCGIRCIYMHLSVRMRRCRCLKVCMHECTCMWVVEPLLIACLGQSNSSSLAEKGVTTEGLDVNTQGGYSSDCASLPHTDADIDIYTHTQVGSLRYSTFWTWKEKWELCCIAHPLPVSTLLIYSISEFIYLLKKKTRGNDCI